MSFNFHAKNPNQKLWENFLENKFLENVNIFVMSKPLTNFFDFKKKILICGTRKIWTVYSKSRRC